MRSGGSFDGRSSGDGNGNAAGEGGVLLPALMSGLPVAGRKLRWATLVNSGLAPRRVLVHSPGTRIAADCTQLLVPNTLRPDVHGSLLCGPQYGVSTSLAGFSRTIAGVLPAAV